MRIFVGSVVTARGLTRVVLSIFSLALLTGLLVPNLYADTIFNNINGPFCFALNCAFPIAGANVGDESEAVAFTSSGNYTVTSAAAELINTFQNTTVNFFIYSNSGGLPNVSLGELGTATLPAGQRGVFTVNAATPISLVAGTQYWLVLAPGDNITEVLWDQGAYYAVPYETSDSGNISGWTSTGNPANSQFEIDGTPIVPVVVTPEPASVWLLLSGGFGVVGLIYNKREAWSR